MKTMINNISNVNQMSADQVFTQLTNLQLENIFSVADVYYYANVFELKSVPGSKSSTCL